MWSKVLEWKKPPDFYYICGPPIAANEAAWRCLCSWRICAWFPGRALSMPSKTKCLAFKSDLYLSTRNFGKAPGIRATAFEFRIMSLQMRFLILISSSLNQAIETSRQACRPTIAGFTIAGFTTTGPQQLAFGGCSWRRQKTHTRVLHCSHVPMCPCIRRGGI